MLKMLVVNSLTFLRLVLSLCFGYLILCQPDQLIALMLTFSLVCASDFFDGRLARRWQVGSRRGAAFDVIADMFFVFVAFIALIMCGMLPAWILAVAVLKFSEFCITSFIARKSGKLMNSLFLFDTLGKLSAILLFILPMLVVITMHTLLREPAGWIVGSYISIVSLMACVSSVCRIGSCGIAAFGSSGKVTG